MGNGRVKSKEEDGVSHAPRLIPRANDPWKTLTT